MIRKLFDKFKYLIINVKDLRYDPYENKNIIKKIFMMVYDENFHHKPILNVNLKINHRVENQIKDIIDNMNNVIYKLTW